MSCLKLCDSDDCYQTENDADIYHIDWETEQFLREHCSHWFNGSFNDICECCIEETNVDYPGFYVINDGDLSISKEYLNNPKLLS